MYQAVSQSTHRDLVAVDRLIFRIQRDHPELFLFTLSGQTSKLLPTELDSGGWTGDPWARLIFRFQFGNSQPDLYTRHESLDGVGCHPLANLLYLS